MSEWAPILSWNGRFGDTPPARRTARPRHAENPRTETARCNLSRALPVLALAWSSALLLAGGAAFAQTRELSSSGVLLDRIAAVVNDGVVLNSQLDEQTEEITQRLRQQNTELPPRNVLRQQMLERLVVEEIQVQRADRSACRSPTRC